MSPDIAPVSFFSFMGGRGLEKGCESAQVNLRISPKYPNNMSNIIFPEILQNPIPNQPEYRDSNNYSSRCKNKLAQLLKKKKTFWDFLFFSPSLRFYLYLRPILIDNIA